MEQSYAGGNREPRYGGRRTDAVTYGGRLSSVPIRFTEDQPMTLSRGTGPAADPRLLHATMVIGPLVILAIYAYLLFAVTGPILETGGVIGLALALAAGMTVVLATTLFRGRVPRRPATQPVAAFWAEATTIGAAIVLWAMFEAAVVIALTAWLLSGSMVALVVALIALGVLILHSPGHLAGK